MTTQVTESELEALLHGALRAKGAGERWATESNESWCRVAPRSGTGPAQGWKLHVSATAASAPAVLEKALDVLLKDGSAFKFARSLEQVSALNTRATPAEARASSSRSTRPPTPTRPASRRTSTRRPRG